MSRKILHYSDKEAIAGLWFKGIFLMPVWGVLAIPIFGAFFSFTGEFVYQTGYALLLLLCGAYFTEDLLKRHIGIDENKIYFGYRSFAIRDLVSVGLTYHANRAVPNKLVMNFASGKKLVLALCRLNADEIDGLLGLIENKLPGCNVDPVLRTLSRCKKLARDTTLDSDALIEVPYNARLMLKQLGSVFMQTALRWRRVGPILACLVTAPIWLVVTQGLYSTMHMIQQKYGEQLALYNLLVAMSRDFDNWLAANMSTFAQNGSQALSNHWAAIIAWIAFAGIFGYFAKYLLQPNVLFFDEKGLRLCQRTLSLVLPLDNLDWSKLTLACLGKPPAGGDPNQWEIMLYASDRVKPLRMALNAIGSEHRAKLVKAIQRWAPHAEIQPELAETLLPKQERSYTELWLQSLASPPERKSLEPLEVQQTLQEGRYEVVRRLGVGGQGRAYLCTENASAHGSNSQEVVLKETILPVYVQNSIRQQALERFQQEATMLEELDSDRIVRLLDYFIEDHRGYLVLEHVDGRNLRQLIDEEGPLSEDEIVDLARQMAQILEYLHSKNMLHRDFTPDNLIIGKNRQLKLIDFNVAQSAETGATGTIVGKHAYVPPEQFRGKPTYQSDIYALGATLFYLATGKDPEPISESNPQSSSDNFSLGFCQLIAQCTKLSCSKRVQTATELLRKIEMLGTLEQLGEAVGDNSDEPVVLKLNEEKETINVSIAESEEEVLRRG